MLDTKQIHAIFLFKFKMGHKAVETICNINNAFGPRTASEHTVQRWFKKFCKGDKRLEDEKCSGQPSEVDGASWEPSSKLILLQLHEKLLKNSVSTILFSFNIWSKLERCENSISQYFMSWLKKKIIILKCHLILCNNEPFLDQIVTWDESGFYMTTSNNHLSGWTEKKLQSTSQSQTCTKKSHGHCLVVCCHFDPLQLPETFASEKYAQQISEIHW